MNWQKEKSEALKFGLKKLKKAEDELQGCFEFTGWSTLCETHGV